MAIGWSASLGQYGSLSLEALSIILTWIGGFILIFGASCAKAALFPLSFLVLAILGTLGMLGYTIANPPRERLTEFYILGLNGEASGYPAQLTVGEEGKVIVGIMNKEKGTTTYRLEVRIDGAIVNQVGPITLERDREWEEIVGFTPQQAGDKQKVEFLLYQQGQTEAYQSLHLWLDVK